MKILILNFIIILRHICHHVKHRKWEPEGVHGQLDGCNRNLRPKAAVANNNHLAPKYPPKKCIRLILVLCQNRGQISRGNPKKS